MSKNDWKWKIEQAFDRIQNRYEHIGRKTGYPFLGIVYPHNKENQVFREWDILINSLDDNYKIFNLDLLNETGAIFKDFDVDDIVYAIDNPMPGSKPEAELGFMWIKRITDKVKEQAIHEEGKKRVIVLKRLAALYPSTTPRSLMQNLWDKTQNILTIPIIVFIPGTLIERRVYKFMDNISEFMYRGDIL